MTAEPVEIRLRAGEIGLNIGNLPTGPLNSITDLNGVMVGQITKISGQGPLEPGIGPVRTGLTVIRPHPGNLYRDRVPAAVYIFNGFGKCAGLEQLDELGLLESPIALCSTMSVPRVADGLTSYAIRENPQIGIELPTPNPFVGECSDAYLNDMQGRHVNESDLFNAIDNASGALVAEGSVGAGTGMSCFGFKGGIGTASRRLQEFAGGWTVGVLVLANFGRREDLVIDGVPVGQLLDPVAASPERGSIMIIVGTDAPLLDRALRRVARRAVIGLARTGSQGGHGSGDVVLAFSTAESVRLPMDPSGGLLDITMMLDDHSVDWLFRAVVEATEESILNALFKATTVVGRDDHRREAIPLDEVTNILRRAGRLRA